MDVGNDTLRVHSYVLLVARSNKQLSNCVVRIVAHVETFGDAIFFLKKTFGPGGPVAGRFRAGWDTV